MRLELIQGTIREERCHETQISCSALAFVLALCRRAGIRANAQGGEGARLARSAASARACRASPIPDDKGNWTGLDVDFCRAIAAAIFNDADQGEVLAALRQGPLHRAAVGRDRRAVAQLDLDAVARHSLGLNFAAVNYYDGQGFMVRKALKVNSALELNGASVCTQTGTTTELNLADYFRANNMKYEVDRVRDRGRDHQGL